MARERLIKASVGRGMNRKEVALRVNKAGLNAAGKQRWAIAFRFADDSYKKASDSEWVTVEIDKDEKKLFFVTGNSKTGYKLCGNANVKTITINVFDIDFWNELVGDYNLRKDIKSGDYYIDFSEGGKA